MSLSNLLNISKAAMLAHQSAINTTARNIANVNTLGYRRRRVDISQLTSNSGYMGFSRLNGVYGQEGVSLIRHQFVENQLRYEHQGLGRYQSDEMMLTQVEDIFSEPLDSGLANVMSEFWNSWSDLANDPTSQSAHSMVRDKGVLLANSFNRVHSELQDLQNQISMDVKDKTDQTNQMITQLADLNKQISSSLSDQLLDQRDQLLNELSTMINIDVAEQSNGTVSVAANGQVLVSGNYKNLLAAEVISEDGSNHVKFSTENGSGVLDVSGGELGSLLNMANKNIPQYISKLDELARGLAERVNAVHSSGMNLDGVTGLSFFADDVSGAADMVVNSAILGDPSLIATGAASGTPGDGSIAQAISDIQNEEIVEGSTSGDFYHMLISRVGSQLQESSFLRSSQEMVVQSLENQRDSVSGVSLDEEMTMLLEFEKGYEASARLIATVDELMQTVINMV